MERRNHILLLSAGSILLAFALTHSVAHRHLHAAAILADTVGAKDPTGIVRHIPHSVAEKEFELELGSDRLRSFLIEPVGIDDPPPVLLLHGVHPDGIDEPSFHTFGRSLAGAGLKVLMPELIALRRHEVTPQVIDLIRRIAQQYAGSEEVGIIAVSFAAGLALMAARGNDHRIGFVFGIGAHHDLARVARYYAGHRVVGPDGRACEVKPHPYGVRMLARSLLDVDEATPSELLMAAEERGAQLAAVSPAGKLAELTTRVFLVHGLDDPVIPSIETRWLAHEVSPGRLGGVVVSRLLRHTDFPKEPRFEEQWELVRLTADVLAAADDLSRSR